jgi:ABC-type Fe3+-hydroxamate transport system substrate-binding protein
LEVNHLPKVAQYPSINIESLLLLKPDLVIAEDSTHMRAQLNQLKALGISVYIVHVRTIDDIPNLLLAIGRITHSEKQAQQSATVFKQRYDVLKQTYQHRSPVSVFYELWPHPLLTVTRNTLINQVINECGGRNIFADAKGEAPEVSTERVLKGHPKVMLMSPESEAEARCWQEEWQGWKDWLPAVSQHHMYTISPDKLARSSPRLLDAMAEVCKDLDFARVSLVSSEEVNTLKDHERISTHPSIPSVGGDFKNKNEISS